MQASRREDLIVQALRESALGLGEGGGKERLAPVHWPDERRLQAGASARAAF